VTVWLVWDGDFEIRQSYQFQRSHPVTIEEREVAGA
jgi:hypothetical protein